MKPTCGGDFRFEIAYVYMQVADHIAARITSGELRPGARLAGERDLGEECGVAYPQADAPADGADRE
ncbi:hypothetical protein [Streptomyces sp. NPDC001978]|uniref:hypothetical protein n=1 Tax=Streptomyces sp. NPDC001978 TaxID=3364627 RepID=UPI00368A3472